MEQALFLLEQVIFGHWAACCSESLTRVTLSSLAVRSCFCSLLLLYRYAYLCATVSWRWNVAAWSVTGLYWGISQIQHFFLAFYVERLHSAHNNAYNSRSGRFWGDNDRRTKPITVCIKTISYKKLFGEVGIAVPKSKGTRVGWRLLIQWSIPATLFWLPKWNNGVAEDAPLCLQPTLLFGTAIPTFPNNFL